MMSNGHGLSLKMENGYLHCLMGLNYESVMDFNPSILHLNLTLDSERYISDFLYIYSLNTALYETNV